MMTCVMILHPPNWPIKACHVIMSFPNRNPNLSPLSPPSRRQPPATMSKPLANSSHRKHHATIVDSRSHWFMHLHSEIAAIAATRFAPTTQSIIFRHLHRKSLHRAPDQRRRTRAAPRTFHHLHFFALPAVRTCNYRAPMSKQTSHMEARRGRMRFVATKTPWTSNSHGSSHHYRSSLNLVRTTTT